MIGTNEGSRERRYAYSIPSYNGFSQEARRATIPVQNEAFRLGTALKPDTCSICEFSDKENPKGRGYMFAHLEDYRQPLAFFACCKSCHAALHARFSNPERWLAILRGHGTQGAWFMDLSLKPTCQTTPFDVTYPRGLN